MKNMISMATDRTFAQFLKQCSMPNDGTLLPEAMDYLQALHDRGSAQLHEQSFPTTRDEEWRFTDLKPLQDATFAPSAKLKLSAAEIRALMLPETHESFMVFVNGQLDCAEISNPPAGLLLSNLGLTFVSGMLLNAPELPIHNYLAKQLGADERFTALNTAGFKDVAIVWVGENTIVDMPIHLLFVAIPGQTPTWSQPRCLIVAEAGSQLTVIEDYITVGDGVHFTNAVTEIWMAENAEVNHTRVQQESQMAFHIGKTAVSQARNSRYTCNTVSTGAKLSRHNLEIHQAEEQTETTLNGLTLIGDEQLADTHSTIAFTKAHGSSRQLHKCIVDDRARAVFNGKVLVPKAAQLTDTGQLSRTLLLSSKARVDTKPQLEIVADNVKCSHGATVSQLDAEEVFYLQSRGLDQTTAQKLLTYAFAAEVINQIPVVSLRDRLAQQVRMQTQD